MFQLLPGNSYPGIAYRYFYPTRWKICFFGRAFCGCYRNFPPGWREFYGVGEKIKKYFFQLSRVKVNIDVFLFRVKD